MEYFETQGYPEAAQKFAAEANIQPIEDIVSVTRRVEIKDAINSGNIQTAIERINEHNPQLLDKSPSLHFSLLRLQLIELIRIANDTPEGDINIAVDFASTHLAPRAPTDPAFLSDLEQAMALLIFKPEHLTDSLKDLLRPSLRQAVAKDVNEALLVASGVRAVTRLGNLIAHRAWWQQEGLKGKKNLALEALDLGLDPPIGNDLLQTGTEITRDSEDGNEMATT